jgi:hypothetical protein
MPKFKEEIEALRSLSWNLIWVEIALLCQLSYYYI